jgi:ABC-type transport system involved in multi-copper enzyme maturation permease subunit
MGGVWHIALNTFRESVRDRVLYVIAFFALVLIGASHGLGWVSVGEQTQIVAHFSLAVMSVFGALLAVFVGTGLIYKEIEKRTVYTILSKPVERWQFVLGKFAGLVAVLFLVVLGSGLFVVAFVAWGLGGAIDLLFLQALAGIFLELTVVTAVAIMVSTVASPILSAIVTFATYLVGQVTPDLLEVVAFKPVRPDQIELVRQSNELAVFLTHTHGFLAPLAKVLYVLLPNLSHFAFRNRVVHGPPLAEGEFALAVVYAVCYSAVVLGLAIALFQRKRF